MSHKGNQAQLPVQRLLQYVLLFYFCALSVDAVAADTSTQARDLINQMSEASRVLNYDGIFIYQRGNQMDTMRLIHKAGEDGEYERLISLTGHAREVIRDKYSVTCIFPENQAVMVEKSRPREFLSGKLPEPIEKISEYYNFAVASSERVAGRDAWIINIIPKDNYRYGYQIWIDKETNLLLKSDLKNRAGVTLEHMLFTQINVLADIPDELLKPNLNGTEYKWYKYSNNKTAAATEKSAWQVSWLPGGFSMSDHEKQRLVKNDMPVDHMIYSDGLATVSVFIEKIGSQPRLQQGASSMGGVNAFATKSADYQVTAVGEVPLATVQQMATSVSRLVD